MKFDIKYMIGQKEKDSLKKIKHLSQFDRDVSPDGWIQITIGDYEYGFLQDDSSINGFELLENWFSTFKDVYLKLQPDSKILFDYWDEPDEFFVFERENNFVTVQYFKKEYLIKDGIIQNQNVYEIRLVAETKIPEELFFSKIKEKVNEFWDEVGALNPILKSYVKEYKIEK